ncbi:MAG: amino acid permease [Legionellales bacterium]|nr:amino acid permease [Legionellales bacterium]
MDKKIQALFRTKKISTTDSDSSSLRRSLSTFDLICMGIGAIVGAGIFVLTGIVAATKAGPAMVLSFVLAGLTSAFAAFSYAELSSSVGGCGSAYGYAYRSAGELFAWIIGWDLLLEYLISAAAVANGWSSYFNDILQSFHLVISPVWLNGPFEGGIINLPAILVVLLTGTLLILGVKLSARFNVLMVCIKLSVIILFILLTCRHVNPANWHPFFPFHWHGVLAGAALVFFAYIGFDAVSTAAEETITPQISLPIGIIVSLLVSTLLYIVVTLVLTGVVPYTQLNVSSPLSLALSHLGYRMGAAIIDLGAIAGLTTVILVMFYGLTRILLAMSRDKLLPTFFINVNSKTGTPIRIIVIIMVINSTLAGLFPLTVLADLVNIGTLSAFIIVCACVIILRHTKPDMERPFKTPFSPLIPGLGIVSCFYLIAGLPSITWLRFLIWLFIGLIIYYTYSRHHSLVKE